MLMTVTPAAAVAVGAILIVLALASAGAVLYRVRGGWHLLGAIGTQAARLVWSLPTGALVAVLAVGPLWIGPATAAGAFAGLLIPHGPGMVWPVAPAADRLRLALGMVAIGAVRLALMAAPAALTVTPWLWLAVAAAPLHAAAYWLGWRLPVQPEWRRNGQRGPVDAETAWAELAWGAVQWPAIGLPLLLTA